MEQFKEFLTIFIPLLIIMDPLGNLPFFILFTKDKAPQDKNRVALVASIASCLILMLFAATGNMILSFFHVSLPAFQLAGGFIFFIYALQMLGLLPSGMKTSSEEEQEGIEKESVALVPLATPLLAGPGAITAVLVWREEVASTLPFVTLYLAILASCFTTYLVFRFGQVISKLLGVGGIRVLTRLMGLLLAVIAVQFMVKGLEQIF